MKTVVTGKFSAVKQATRAVDKLLRSCVPCDHVRTFLVKPSHPSSGSHKKASPASSTDEQLTPHAPSAGAVGLEVKSAAVADGVGVNAYVGSLEGALDKIGEDRRDPSRPSGIVVAVEASDHVSQVLAISVLREHGARVIERDAGPWHDGNWPGFKPVPLSSLIDLSVDEKSETAALLRPKLNS
jgi:hypothetical protein